jgi:hypothetical protein
MFLAKNASAQLCGLGSASAAIGGHSIADNTACSSVWIRVGVFRIIRSFINVLEEQLISWFPENARWTRRINVGSNRRAVAVLLHAPLDQQEVA